MQRGVDEAGLIADGFHSQISAAFGGEGFTHLRQLALDDVDDFDGIGAALLLDDQENGVVAVEAADGAGFFVAVVDFAEVADADGLAGDVGNDDVAELIDVLDAAHGSQDQLAGILIDAPAGQLEVLIGQCLANVFNGKVVGLELAGVDGDVDSAAAAADQ